MFLHKTFVRSVAKVTLLRSSKVDLAPDLRSLTKPVCARDTPQSTFMITQLEIILIFRLNRWRADYRGIIVAKIKRLKFGVNENYAELSEVMAG